MVKKTAFLSLPLSLSRSLETSLQAIAEALSRKEGMLITFINPHAFYLRAVDQGYANCLWHFNMVLADGIGVTKALRWITGEMVQRQSFDCTSLFPPLLTQLNESKKSICIVGGRPGVAEGAMDRMKDAYPDVRYLGSQDGFQSFDRLVEWVLEKQPDVALVGMGAPNQEKFLLRLRQSGFHGVGITCGGFLDQYLQKDNYYPAYIDHLNLRFLYRLMKEPRRLARRYFVEYQAFLLSVGQVLFLHALFRR
jgi:N-acetylglucosaminyldiphosphoundecaprenol N-acetyl-beta-D-mannosaminyltransferase